jgi:hypothetical protein
MNAQGKLAARLFLQLTAGMLVLVLFSSFVMGQKTSRNPFATVPLSVRAGLVARLKLLIKYQRRHRWDREFNLLTNLYLQAEDESREAFVKTKKRYYAEGREYKLLGFSPVSVDGRNELQDGGEWAIHGCGSWLVKGRTVKYDSSVIAVRQRGDWYFSEVIIVTSVGGPPMPCL